eukprot:TRINITY_DN11119_c0_g1_i1.p1 TRINITY_DN11119_c0_g1~~TRINITY_DN11119_c0_g1_i1.p1  ORF type:complete len:402 (+),score=84.99 TRINITY_DN11119_c0_g1_i1:67-1272(+)
MFQVIKRCSNVRANASKNASRTYAGSSGAPLKRTALYDLHVSLGGKMVPFAGYEMPVQYPDGILQSHLHCRNSASLFDVSHMGQLKITGKDRVAFVEHVTVADVANLPQFHGCYSVIPNEKGGIIDDTIVTNAGDFVYVVINAGCFDKDMKHLRAQEAEWKSKGKDITIQHWQRSQVALQGPLAAVALQRHTKTDLNQFKFFTGGFIDVDGVSCYIQRSGYTGEDGFELSIPSEEVVKIVKNLLNEPEVKICGLGARDSLRLEAGLCLYGNDLDEVTSPKQAGINWTISKRRAQEGGFIGAGPILAEQALKLDQLPKRRVGLLVEGAPAREGATIHDPVTGSQIGVVTSGTMSPVLNRPIAMGFVKPPFHTVNTAVQVEVRGKKRPAVVSKLPFVPTKYKN